MLHALLRKQLLENLAFFTFGKGGKRRSTKGIVGIGILMLYVVGVMGFLFFEMGKLLCVPFVALGMAWVYFAFMGTLAIGLGVIGSIFSTKTALYEAKDNDLLLSMPIPSWVILCVRTVGLYAIAFCLQALVFVPAIVAFFVEIGFSAPVLMGSIFALFIMPFGTLAVSCILGWLIALVTAKLPAKNVSTLVFALAGFVLYFVLYSKITEYLTYVVENGEAVGAAMKTTLYPFGQLGLACMGEGLPLLIFTGIFLGVFVLVYAVISATYIRLVTANRGNRKSKYKSKEKKQGSWFAALLKKEARRYTKNAMVAMNCFLGCLFFVAVPVLLLLFATELRELAFVEELDGILALIFAAMLCMLASMNMISAASISLEGESLWVVRSLPIQTEKILFVKASFAFLMTAVPALLSGIFLCIYFKINVWLSLVLMASVLAFVALTSLLGLIINVKLPNLHWKNELVAVKQSASTLLCMLAEWGIVLLLGIGYFLFGKYLHAGVYLFICLSLLLLAGGACAVWLMKKGKEIFENL